VEGTVNAALAEDARCLLERLRPSGAPALREMGLERARAYVDALPRIVGPGPELAHVCDVWMPVVGGSIPLRVYEPNRPARKGTLVYVHGGGWALGSLDSDDALARRLAVASDGRVVSVGYRRAPEHPFPVPLDDVVAAVTWVGEQFGGQLLLVGESAGANLAVAASLQLAGGAAPSPAGLVLVCPVVDHEETASYAERGTGGLLEADDVRWFWDLYVPDRARRDDPLAAPLRHPSYDRLPPVFLVTAEHDPLRDEGFACAARLQGARRLARHVHRPDLMHGFLPLAGLLAGAGEVVAEIGAFAWEVTA
jgi:acetyl esterase